MIGAGTLCRDESSVQHETATSADVIKEEPFDGSNSFREHTGMLNNANVDISNCDSQLESFYRTQLHQSSFEHAAK